MSCGAPRIEITGAARTRTRCESILSLIASMLARQRSRRRGALSRLTGCLGAEEVRLYFATFEPTIHRIEVQVNHRRRVQSEDLRNEETSHDRHAEWRSKL